MTLINDDGYPYRVYRSIEQGRAIDVSPGSAHHFDLPLGASATVSTLDNPLAAPPQHEASTKGSP